MGSYRDTIILDAVHGQMIIPAVCKAVINTKEFQRLRNITQSGIANYVYPTANHTRFEHSLGVCYYSRLFMECLVKNSREHGESLTYHKQLCIQLAGLCHDLGHGPFSHTWEEFVNQDITLGKEKFEHEKMSKEIFRHIYNKYDHIKKVFNHFGILEEDVNFICDVITNDNLKFGDQSDADSGKIYSNSERYLFQIIANKESGIDVDKVEYLKRDTHQFGMQFSIDVFRIFNNARIIENPEGTAIAYRDKVHGNIFDMFLTRAKMHYSCYQHPKKIRIETMLIDALKESDNEVPNKLSDRHMNLEEYLKLDNSIINRLKGAKAQSLIDRIYNRDIYKFIHREIIEKDDEAKIKLVQEKVLKELFDEAQYESRTNNPALQNIPNENIWFKAVKIILNLGQANGADTDPLKNVNFYNKENKLIKDYSVLENSFAPRFYSKDSKFSCVMIIVYCTLTKIELKQRGLSLKVFQKKAKKLFDEALNQINKS